MDFVRNKITLPSPQSQITEEERNNSDNLDILGTLLTCEPLRACDEDDFSVSQKEAITIRMEELTEDLKQTTYSTAEAAARAIHDSELFEFARELGIEFGVIIDDTNSPVEIESSFTSFRSDRVGFPVEMTERKTAIHNHPRGGSVWQQDAVAAAEIHGKRICQEDQDYTIYASGAYLSRAKVKQVVGITDPSSFRFELEELRNGKWESESDAFDNSADPVSFDCPKIE